MFSVKSKKLIAMPNKRYYVDPKEPNDFFTAEEIIKWNTWLKSHYKVYHEFRQQCRCDIAARVKQISARDIVAIIRRRKKLKVKNEASTFLAFTFVSEFPQYKDRFKINRKKLHEN